MKTLMAALGALVAGAALGAGSGWALGALDSDRDCGLGRRGVEIASRILWIDQDEALITPTAEQMEVARRIFAEWRGDYPDPDTVEIDGDLIVITWYDRTMPEVARPSLSAPGDGVFQYEPVRACEYFGEAEATAP